MVDAMLGTGLYALVDLDSLERAGVAPLAYAEAVFRGRPAVVQLRAKRATARETLDWLTQLSVLGKQYGVPLFANDRPDLAVLAGASGVHVGQGDLPLEAVLRFASELGVGVSTHDLDQLRAALLLRPTYVAYGPVFPTASKQNPEPCVGLDGLAAAHQLAVAARVPLVAIGGVDLGRARELRPHAELVAVIGDLLPGAEGLAEVTARVAEYQRIWQRDAS